MVHVLVMAIVVSVIAAGLVRMVLMRYTATQRLASGVVNKKLAESTLDQMYSAWNKSNSFCASFGAYSCSGAATCGAVPCTCTASGQPSISVAFVAGQGCKVTITTP